MRQRESIPYMAFDNSNSSKTLSTGNAPVIPGTEQQQQGLLDNDGNLPGGSQVFPLTGAKQISTEVGVSVKQVDYKTITGSNPGDHRSPSKDTAKDSLNQSADNGGVRKAVGQFALGKNTKRNAGTSQPFPDVNNIGG